MLFTAEQERSKRQSVVSRPLVEYVFDQRNDPIREAEFYPGEFRAARSSAKWDLGYDAGDILNPPELEVAESRYRTLNIFNGPTTEAPIVWGTLKEGAVINRPQRSSVEGSKGEAPKQRSARKNQREEAEDDDDEEEEKSSESDYSPEGHSYHQVPASIYTFVKTDPHGNFKWGVRKGPPVRG